MKAFLVEPQARCDLISARGDAPPWLAVQVAKSFVARARGLLGRPEPPPACGLLLPNVAAVHGFGMRHALDLVFLDRHGKIVQCRTLLPAAVARCRDAQHVLEMRAGEVRRLRLEPNMQPRLVPVEDIFVECASPLTARERLARASPPGEGQQPRYGAAWIVASLLAGCLLGSLPAASARSGDLGPLSLVRPVSAQTLQRLEEEAEALYRDDGLPESSIAGLVSRYESLAEFSEQRSPHAWLRIGNIHQRAGAVGEAIDAYRRVRSTAAQDDAATTAERKALLNLAALALDQARQSLTRLAALPAAGAATARADDPLQQQAERLQQHLHRQLERQSPLLVSETSSESARSPQVVERYTASARRNAVKAARGSLHANPANELPAAPVARPRPRSVAPLPSVEYLQGDPLRSVKPRDGAKAAGGQADHGGPGARPR